MGHSYGKDPRRNGMYCRERDRIYGHKRSGKILDVGCGVGAFLDCFDYPLGFDHLVCAFVNANSLEGYMKMVAHFKTLGIGCSFVVPPSKIGLEV